MNILSGKTIASEILDRVRSGILHHGIAPVFAAVLVGDDPASALYVKLKQSAAQSVGVDFRVRTLSKSSSKDDILRLVNELNRDASVHGILVQLPLPSPGDTQAIIDAVDPKKDIDGFHPDNVRRFLVGDPCLTPVFPKAIFELIHSAGVSLSGKKMAVIGNSRIFGDMIMAMGEREGLQGTFLSRETIGCASARVLAADVVVSACGVPNLITGKMVKDGAIVIDGGIVKDGERVVGDIDRASMESKPGFLSPVPGGVGPVTIACLLENVFLAAQNAQTDC